MTTIIERFRNAEIITVFTFSDIDSFAKRDSINLFAKHNRPFAILHRIVN